MWKRNLKPFLHDHLFGGVNKTSFSPHFLQIFVLPVPYSNPIPLQVREINMLVEDHTTYYGQPMTNIHLRETWTDCKVQSDYDSNVKKVQEFNRNNRWKKRGIAIMPMTYALGYRRVPLERSLNQVSQIQILRRHITAESELNRSKK